MRGKRVDKEEAKKKWAKVLREVVPQKKLLVWSMAEQIRRESGIWRRRGGTKSSYKIERKAVGDFFCILWYLN